MLQHVDYQRHQTANKVVKRVLTVVGARPQFVKAGPVSRALATAGISETLVHTGQHFDPLMSDVFFDDLDIPKPAYNLEINSLSHGAMTGRMIEKLEQVMITEAPEMLIVYGDTNSTLAAALAAAKLHIPIAHIEAGPRSFNRTSPEEINRVIVDHLSALLFCPTASSVENLKNEGISRGVHAVGDVMFDATLAAVERAKDRSGILERLGLSPKSYTVATVHREENTADPERFSNVMAWLERAAEQQPVIMPTHPRTKKLLEARGMKLKGVQVIEPVGYLDMAWLVHHAKSMVTDSGGLQKEAYFHRVPCVTLLEETEWPETIDAGWNRLWTSQDYAPQREISDYGIGNCAEKIAEIVRATV